MIADAIKSIKELIVTGLRPTIIPVEGLPDQILLGKTDGSYELIEKPPKARNYKLAGLTDLIDMCEGLEDGLIFVEPDKVTLIFDAAKRRERATLPLVMTTRFSSVIGLSPNRGVQAGDLVRSLRGIFGRDPAIDAGSNELGKLISELRRFDYKRVIDGTSVTTKGRDTMGRNIDTQVAQADKIPDVVRVTVPVYMTSGFAAIDATIALCVELNKASEPVTISLFPFGDEADTAKRDALTAVQHAILAALGEQVVTVVIGSPD